MNPTNRSYVPAESTSTSRDLEKQPTRLCEKTALWLLIGIIAWVQFPLGSARPWAWSALALLVAINWLVWLPDGLSRLDETIAVARRFAIPAGMMAFVLVWAGLQSAPWTPEVLHHPIWDLPREALSRSAQGYVSLNPYNTTTETMKLLTFAAVGWLTFILSTRRENAHMLFLALFFVGLAYSIYGIVLSALGTSQITLLEGVRPLFGRDVTGALVARSSFSTIAGISFLVGLALVGEAAGSAIVTWRGWQPLIRTILQFAFGRGAVWLAGTLIVFAALVAAASRAGLIATLFGLMIAFCFALAFAVRRQSIVWTLAGEALAAAAVVAVFTFNGSTGEARIGNLIETARAIELGPVMWQVAERAINDRPLSGIGLGAYHDAFYLFADKFVPYIVDRAHNDYLELAAGLGLPATVIWVGALFLIVLQCVAGAFRRRRSRMYPVTAVCVAAVVGIHSISDFSLQVPADSLWFAVVLAIGLAQSTSSGIVQNALAEI